MRSSNLSWCLPPEALTLGNDEVHVWRIALELPAADIQSLLATLTADERARAERFRFQKDREHFIVGRGGLEGNSQRLLEHSGRPIAVSLWVLRKTVFSSHRWRGTAQL